MARWMRRDSSQMINDHYRWFNHIKGTETTKADAIHNIVKEAGSLQKPDDSALRPEKS